MDQKALRKKSFCKLLRPPLCVHDHLLRLPHTHTVSNRSIHPSICEHSGNNLSGPLERRTMEGSGTNPEDPQQPRHHPVQVEHGQKPEPPKIGRQDFRLLGILGIGSYSEVHLAELREASARIVQRHELAIQTWLRAHGPADLTAPLTPPLGMVGHLSCPSVCSSSSGACQAFCR